MSEAFNWPEGKKAAVSIVYERCASHAVRRLPSLTSGGVGATIFLEATDLLEDPRLWRNAIGLRHEVGNACLHCVTDDGSLPDWTLSMIEHEIEMEDELLDDFLPDPVRPVFVVPGPNLNCREGSYSGLLESRYEWVVGSATGLNHPVFSNAKSLSKVPVVQDSLHEVLDHLEHAVDAGVWCILSFDLRSEPVRRFHDSFVDVLPRSMPNVLWRPAGEIGRMLAAHRQKLTAR